MPRCPASRRHARWPGRRCSLAARPWCPLECIVRARLAGQAYEEYAARGTIHAMPMPAGLELADKLPEPIFTPSTKAAVGHDVNLYVRRGVRGRRHVAGRAPPRPLPRDLRASQPTGRRGGLVLADTKFEVGLVDGELVLCDEVVTPDSSRLWPADTVVRGEPPPGVRQAAVPRLAGRPALGPHAAAAAGPRRRRRRDVASVRRGVRARDRARARRLVRSRPVRFDARVEVTLRDGIADPEGSTIERALPALGFEGVPTCAQDGRSALASTQGRGRGEDARPVTR